MVTGEIKEKERKSVLRRSTRRTGAFEYRLRLPGEIDTEKINAQMSDGVLTITVPKAEVAKPGTSRSARREKAPRAAAETRTPRLRTHVRHRGRAGEA